MKKTLCKFTILLAIALLQSCSLSIQLGKGESGTIVATGVGEVNVVPDVAVFSFTVREEDKDIKTAQKKMSEKAEKAVAKLREKEIAEKDIKTSNYFSNPKYSYSPGGCDKGICVPSKQILIGYESSETIQVKVRDLTKAGDILTEIAQLSIVEVSNLSFTVEDLAKFKALAKAEAIVKAKEDAKTVAQNLGVSLGKIIAMNEDEFGGPRHNFAVAMSSMKAMRMESASPVPPINSGEEKITFRVSITYQIK